MPSTKITPAHKLLLRNFIFPSTIENAIQANRNWSISLGEEPRIAIDRFISERLLATASLKEKLSILSIDELQKALETSGVSMVDVQKEQVINILSSTVNELAEKLDAMEMYICTERGRQLINDRLTKNDKSLLDGAKKTISWLDKKGVTGNFIYDILRTITAFIAGVIFRSIGNWIGGLWKSCKEGLRKLLTFLRETWHRLVK